MQGAEFHHGLVVSSRVLLVEQAVGQFGENFDAFITINRCFDVIKPCQHAVHVAIDYAVRLVEGDGSDGSGGILADAFQLKELFGMVWEVALVVCDELARALVQVPGPGVITQPLPHLENLFLVGLGKVGKRGPALHETVEVVQPLTHLRLLEDHLRQPHMIRRWHVAPRKLPFVSLVPSGKDFLCLVHKKLKNLG